mmetsp:Transcript_92007/g.166120  ORF Transcript_92007/g.166120 Transcript_92007/m.166120 type:complete len:201 (-) Transcript_92007:378-980(-)
MLVHGASALQELLHGAKAVLKRQRKHTHGTAHGEATPHPVPEAEDIGRIDAKGLRLVQRSGACHDMFRNTGLAPKLLDEPGLDSTSIQHGLGSGEGLGNDDHQRRLCAETLQRALHIDGVHVGKEAEPPALRQAGGGRVRLQRLKDELHAQVGATDADAHHVSEWLAGVADEAARSELLREGFHGIQHCVHLWHDILALH